jgi:lysophospholipase L1-like esterase
MRRALPWLIALLATLAAVASLWRPESVLRRLGLGPVAAERQYTAWRSELRAHYRRLDANTPPGATVFLGASTVQGLNAAQVRPCHAAFGIGSERAPELVERLGDYRSLDRAAAIVVLTGLNDVLQGEGDRLGVHYRALLAALPARPPILMSSMQPLSPQVASRGDRAAAVVRANAEARAACAARPGCRFVDLHGAMAGSSGLLERDGIHLAPGGYALWARLLRQSLAASNVSEAPCTVE